MARITLRGNIGSVRKDDDPENGYFSFTVAESFSYFDKQKNEWVEKGTQWHECIVWTRGNTERYNRFIKLLIVGAEVTVNGRTSVNPSEKDGQQYLNPYVLADEIGLGLTRLDSVTYKPKSTNNPASDPEMQNMQNAAQDQGTPFDDTQNAAVDMLEDNPF